MLIAAAAAILLFFGESSTGLFGELANKFMEDPIKDTIVDEQRRDLALKQLSLLQDRIKELNEQETKAAKELSGLVKDYSSRPGDFDRLMSSVGEQRQLQVEKIWEERSAMLVHIRPDEWKLIFESAKAAAHSIDNEQRIWRGREDGEVNGRIDADTFRIWKGTPHPDEAFEVLSYLITTGGDTLLPAYGAMPAIPEKTEAFFSQKSKDYPFVTPESWDVFVQGLAYPYTPSSEQYQPNSIEAVARFATFFDLMNNTPPDQMDFDAEYQKLVDDLNTIYNK